MSARPKELSEEMQSLVRFMSLRPDRSVHRHPGGYWSGPGDPKSFMSLFGTSSVAALVKRGVAEYSLWKPGRAGPFPVRATLKAAPEAIDTTKDLHVELSVELSGSAEECTYERGR